MRSEDMAMLLVEGRFKSDDTIRVETSGNVPEQNSEKISECWTVTIPNDGAGTHKIHYVLPDNVKNADISVLREGKWEKVSCSTDGDYLVFEAEGEQVTFSVEKKSMLYIYIAAAAAVLVLAAAVYAIIRKKKKKPNQ